MIDSKEKVRKRRVSICPPLPSKGIKTNSSLDRRPIPPPLHQVVPTTGALASRRSRMMSLMRVGRPQIYSQT